jgi:hypothetical protein
VSDIELNGGENGELVTHAPQARYARANEVPLHCYGDREFCRFGIRRDLTLVGVYMLTVNREVRYVGECIDISDRFNNGYGNISPRNCFIGGQQTNCRINKLVAIEAQAGASIRLWFLETGECKAIEAQLIQALDPAWNLRS